MKKTDLIITIEKKIKEFEKEYEPLKEKFFGKKSSFKDEDLNRGAFLEQRIDDLKNILGGLKKGEQLLKYHKEMLIRADINLK